MAAPNPDAENDTPDELPDAAVEARWADLVAQLEGPGAATGPRPAAPEPLPEPLPVASPEDRGAGSGPRDWPASPEVEALEEAESHFTPPEPEPLLSREPLLTLAWALVAGIPVLTLVLVVVRAAVPTWALPSWIGPAGGVLFLGAVATLLWRMPHHRDPDDDGTGAVV